MAPAPVPRTLSKWDSPGVFLQGEGLPLPTIKAAGHPLSGPMSVSAYLPPDVPNKINQERNT